MRWVEKTSQEYLLSYLWFFSWVSVHGKCWLTEVFLFLFHFPILPCVRWYNIGEILRINKCLFSFHSLFSVLHLVALTGNILIIIATPMNDSLYSTMYFFCKHLSFLDLLFLSLYQGSFAIHSCILAIFPSGSAYCSVSLSVSVVLWRWPCSEWCLRIAMWLPAFHVLWNHHECQQLYSWNLSYLDQWGPLWSYAYICYFPQPLLWCQHHLSSLLLCPPAPEIHLFWWVCQWAWGYWLPVLGDISLFCPCWILPPTHICVEDPICWGHSHGLFHLSPNLAVIILLISTGVLEFLKPHSDAPAALDFLLPVFHTVLSLTLNPII